MSLHRLTMGDVFAGSFQILGVLGSGSMGVVYRARRLDGGREVALKLMHPVLSTDPKSVHRFEREARAGMSIRSRHVARILDTGYDDETSQRWIEMELAHGCSLGSFVEVESPIVLGEAIELLGQLFAALSAAHDAGVVHRDLKPDNIIVRRMADGTLDLKVLDFGVAKSLSSATAISTSPGQGTPLWTAPEQTRLDDRPSPRADVWALGLLTFFVLTGQLYWLNARGQVSMVRLSMELVREPIVPPTHRAAELGLKRTLPDGFDDWFTRCVNREPAQRFDDASQALGGLMKLLDRRARVRYRLWLPVYTDQLSGGVAITHDASTTGMLLLSRSQPEPGTRLLLRFCLPPAASESMEVQASVVRATDNLEDPGGLWPCQLAVCFDAPLPTLEHHLAELQRSLEESQRPPGGAR